MHVRLLLITSHAVSCFILEESGYCHLSFTEETEVLRGQWICSKSQNWWLVSLRFEPMQFGSWYDALEAVVTNSTTTLLTCHQVSILLPSQAGLGVVRLNKQKLVNHGSNLEFLIGIDRAFRQLFVFLRFIFGVTVERYLELLKESTWNLRPDFRKRIKPGYFLSAVTHSHPHLPPHSALFLCIHYSEWLLWICQHVIMHFFLLLQWQNLFWPFINVKLIPFNRVT